MFTQSLANSHSNVGSVKNYLSGAKTFVRHIGGDTTPFDSPILARLSHHIPSSPLVMTAPDVRRCADDLRACGPLGVVARGAMLFAVATFLRQSNFLVGGRGGGGDHCCPPAAIM